MSSNFSLIILIILGVKNQYWFHLQMTWRQEDDLNFEILLDFFSVSSIEMCILDELLE